jgi:hypothetical protein
MGLSIDSDNTISMKTETYSVEITQDSNTAKMFESSIQSDLMESVVNYFIGNHDLISAIDPLPYIPTQRRAIINDEPTYNGNKMRQPRELEQGYYLEVNLSWNQKRHEIERMAEACGVEISIKHDNKT